jgi:toxin FitB
MTYLLSSDILSNLASKNPDPGIIRWLDAQSEESVYISVVSISEISELIDKNLEISEKNIFTQWLKNDLLIRFSGRICEISVAVSLKWGEVMSHCRSFGRALSMADSINLAIALVYGHTLVTRNIAVFEDSGVKTICPFDKPA